MGPNTHLRWIREEIPIISTQNPFCPLDPTGTAGRVSRPKLPKRIGNSGDRSCVLAPAPMQISDSETDEILAAAATSGTTDAFATLVRRHGGAVQVMLERLVGDHHAANDLVQEVWIKVHRSLAAFDTKRSFRPWLLQIAMNQGRDALRKRARTQPTVSVYDESEATRTMPDSSSGLLERAEIEHVLGRVDEPFREALVLVDVLGLSYQEAADTLECALGTVKSRVGRGRGLFRRHYDDSATGGEPVKRVTRASRETTAHDPDAQCAPSSVALTGARQPAAGLEIARRAGRLLALARHGIGWQGGNG
ncbi:MAG: RNA polymerase sigma-70 factor (ECF subfamily) [Planctomycetota bacterium]|jgi:RNA polymerase sigma-70 factor (ECF subfamily)